MLPKGLISTSISYPIALGMFSIKLIIFDVVSSKSNCLVEFLCGLSTALLILIFLKKINEEMEQHRISHPIAEDNK
jgi:hypothetical protein